jgi:hypothetical protein
VELGWLQVTGLFVRECVGIFVGFQKDCREVFEFNEIGVEVVCVFNKNVSIVGSPSPPSPPSPVRNKHNQVSYCGA